MPALSPTMTTGTIGSWNVKEGGTVKSGQVMASIETDKAAVDFEVNEDTIIGKILQEEGTSDLPVGTVIAIGADDEDEVKELASKDKAEFIKSVQAEAEPKKEDKKAESTPEPSKTPASPKSTPTPSSGSSSSSGADKTFISPVMKVKYQSDMAKVDAAWQSGFRGTGPNGRIVLADEAALQKAIKGAGVSAGAGVAGDAASTKSSVSISSAVFDLDHTMTNVDFKMLKRDMAMLSNKSVPHQQINHEVSIDNTIKFIEKINSLNPKEPLGDLKSLILFAISKSSMDCEYARYKWYGSEIRCYEHVNLSLHLGHQFKVLNAAEKMGMTGWKSVLTDGFSEIKYKDTLDGNISVRLDSTGYELCQADESIFLGVSGEMDKMSLNKSNEAQISKKLYLYSSFDHRTIDGAEAAQQLNKVKGYIEQPESMLL